MDSRLTALHAWLVTQLPSFRLEPMVGDASFRRYFRVYTPHTTYVAMDAPPEQENNCVAFVSIAKGLRAVDIAVPEIFASDFSQGFILMTDFGNKILLKELHANNAEKLYTRALNVLARLSCSQTIPGWTLSVFTVDLMRKELHLFQEWFLQRYLNLSWDRQTENQLAACFDFLAHSATEQPQVFMHRDYHSANLMVLPEEEIGVLDFQDAFIGPVTYDLVSLLRDCYIAWPENLVHTLALHYWQTLALPNVSSEMFLRWFDLMGLQRHMKALLTFSRKFCRDNNSNYLQHIPRTLGYITAISARYPECKGLHQFISDRVLTCVQ